MRGSFHQFVLLSGPPRAWDAKSSALSGLAGELELPDDCLRYMYDSLLWIPSLNPCKALSPQTGLNLYGQTVITLSGAGIGRRIFRAWAELFRCGPEILQLTGDYEWSEDEPQMGEYQRLRLRRDEIAAVIEGLAGYCQRVEESDDREFILHLGI